ncbi:hypothetical protein OH76DRAFT_1557557 [Lentinus brumalis]|uniref:Mid2 domain-containing protein n=1 Tax=Lentinus brumalis TaxID=2498619 RepID=A0A371D5H2_9APHY|nr:hypothetical protein OH76DRAFT_1557557 [Polyporus brumalis]
MRMLHYGLLVSISYLLQACAANFTFTSQSEATECNDFQVSWTGGTPPFQLTIVQVFGGTTNLNIPDIFYTNNDGSFTTPVELRAGKEMVVIMSDSTGFGSGGVSPVIKVGNADKTKPQACADGNPADFENDFIFTTNETISQCKEFTFENYDGSTQPVQITGVIPDGSIFVLNPANGSKTFSWIPNVAGGTQLFFYMVDSLGQQGGTTGVMTVEQSGDSSCLDSSSPASTGNPSSLVTATSTSTSTQTGTISASSSTSHRRVGTLIAAIVVPVVAVITLVIGVFICYRRRRRNGGVRVLGPRKSRKPVVDLMKGDPDTPPQMEEVGSPTTATPFLHGRSLSANGETTLGGASSPPDTSATTPQSNAQSGGSSSLAPVSASGIQPAAHAGARRKAAEASVLAPPGHQPSTRFILHTDIEDDVPPPVEEVVELPPQYSERRRAGPVASRSNSHPQVGEPSVPQL